MKNVNKKNACGSCGGTGEDKPRKGNSGPVFKCQDCNGDGKRHKFEMFFWHYSQFPFVLAGVGFMEDNGMAHIPSYNASFRPFMALNLKDGKALKDQLETLQQEHRTATETLELGFKARLRSICPKALK